MSCLHLPPEIFDYIVDFLRGERKTLKNCCLVSRSWVPRARKHLFDELHFDLLSNLNAWNATFPDPVNSPAHYTRFLTIACVRVIPAVDVKESSWVRGFSNAVRLRMWDSTWDLLLFPPTASHRFSNLPVGYKTWSASGLFHLVFALPLLKDLSVVGYGIQDADAIFQSSTSPPLTGTLALHLIRGMGPVTCRLLEPPNSVHFRKLECTLNVQDDLLCIADIAEACSDTLECIDITIPSKLHPVGFFHGSLTNLHLFLR